jgi:hypothetical protein
MVKPLLTPRASAETLVLGAVRYSVEPLQALLQQ